MTILGDASELSVAIREAHRASSGLTKYGESGDHIRTLQAALVKMGQDPGPVDGIYGLMTETAVHKAFPAASQKQESLQSDEAKTSEWIRFDSAGGLDLRSVHHGGPVRPRSNGRDRYISKRPEDRPRVIVLHWTGGPATAARLVEQWSKTDRAVSSHGCIDLSGAYQLLPWGAWAYHAGWVNQLSVGLDISQPVQSSRLNEARGIGYTTDVVENTTGRGESKCLSLDPRIADRARKAVFQLCEALDVPIAAPRGPDGKVAHGRIWSSRDELINSGFRGIVGHHHCESPSRRWDIAPWWPALFDGTSAGDQRG
jgi:hypothetical protein